MEVIKMTQEDVKKNIKLCEGKHIQQVAYSSYHDSLTQVCFGCDVVRTNLNIVNKQSGISSNVHNTIEMTSKKAVERMREIEERINNLKAQINWENDPIPTIQSLSEHIELLKQGAREIYIQFQDGCGENFIYVVKQDESKNWLGNCGIYKKKKYLGSYGYKCPNCIEIKEIWERING